jgi:hypothetical protein
LRPWDVIVGKLAASCLGAVYGLLAVLPVMAVPLLLGGVSIGDFSRAVAAVCGTMFWSLSAGVLVSTFHTQVKSAMNQTLGLIMLLAALCPALGGMLTAWLENRWGSGLESRLIASPLFMLSPGTAMFTSFSAIVSRTGGWWLYAGSLGSTVIGGFFMLWIGARRLPKCWQDQVARSTPFRLADMLDPGADPVTASSARRTRWLSKGPIVWLVCRKWWRRNTPWFFIGATIAAYLGMGWYVGTDWWCAESFLGFSIFLHLVFKAWMSGEASRQVFEDRRSGAMEQILTTPLTDKDFVNDHLRAAAEIFVRPLALVLALDLLLFIALARLTIPSEPNLSYWPLCWLFRAWFLMLDAVAISMHGLWDGVSSRRIRHGGSTFGLVVVLPWGLIALLASAIYLPRQGWNEDPLSLAAKLWIWFGIGTLVSCFVAFGSWGLMRGNFRAAAAVRPGEKSREAG